MNSGKSPKVSDVSLSRHVPAAAPAARLHTATTVPLSTLEAKDPLVLSLTTAWLLSKKSGKPFLFSSVPVGTSSAKFPIIDPNTGSVRENEEACEGTV